jgi:uncharacterized protein with HEPN domain
MGDDISRIRAILQYCDSIEEKMNRFGNDIEDFMDDRDYQHGCSFCVSQAGENIKHLSPELIKKYPEIQWREFSGMRDIISHGYHKIDLETMWRTITEDIPVLKDACERILREL